MALKGKEIWWKKGNKILVTIFCFFLNAFKNIFSLGSLSHRINGEGFMQKFMQNDYVCTTDKNNTVVTVKDDVRSFEYTRQQWTGKSPKQFLIDWIRKHLPKSPPPKFQKMNPKGNKFKCK